MQEFFEAIKFSHVAWWQCLLLATVFTMRPIVRSFATMLLIRDLIRLSKAVPPEVVKDALPLIFASAAERKSSYLLSNNRNPKDGTNVGRPINP